MKSKYVKYVVGMSREIKDNHAIDFAEAFYDSLFTGSSIKTAFDLGKNEIRRLYKQKHKAKIMHPVLCRQQFFATTSNLPNPNPDSDLL